MSLGYCARWTKPYQLIQPPHSSTYAVAIIGAHGRQGGPNHPIRPSVSVPPMIVDPIRWNPMDIAHKVQGHASEGHHLSQR